MKQHEYDLDKENAKYPLLICPYCRKTIPKVFLMPSDGKMDLKVKCSCIEGVKVVCLHDFMAGLRKNQQKSKSGKDELTIEENLDELVECQLHRDSFYSYCKPCKVHLCNKCLENHQGHQLTTNCAIIIDKVPEDYFEDFKKKNRNITDAFIQRLECQNNESSKAMKEEIKALCETNEIINEDLRLLYKSIYRTNWKTNYGGYELRNLSRL